MSNPRRKKDDPTQQLTALAAFIGKLPSPQREIAIGVGLAGLILVAIVLFISAGERNDPAQPPGADAGAVTRSPDGKAGSTDLTPLPGGGREVVFVFWNVENLFDDRIDDRNDTDRPYDKLFAESPQALAKKLTNIASEMLKVNHGKGPDILALCEVETLRAAELLRQELNRRLPSGVTPYSEPVMKELTFGPGQVGRNIAPAVLTRLPVVRDRTKLLGSRQRILRAVIELDGHELVLIPSHWTSRVSDKTGNGRANYAKTIYGEFKAMYLANPQVACLICGDFNDNPDDPSVVEHLKALDDPKAVLASNAPHLLNLMAKLDRNQHGTLWYSGRFDLFDQIVVSPAMINGNGWRADLGSVGRITTPSRPNSKVGPRPWRFEENKKTGQFDGYSDHYPVTVKLIVP